VICELAASVDKIGLIRLGFEDIAKCKVLATRLHVKKRKIKKNVFMGEIIVIFEVKKKLPDRAIWKLS
jgi:hypothetical protein